MAVTINAGLVATNDPLANELKVDMREKIATLEPDTTQFTTMLMHPKFTQERANSFKKEWLNDRLLPRNTALAATAASADTVLTVTTSEGNYFKVGDILKITLTGEAVRVTGTAASSATVVRAVGTVGATSAVSGAAIIITNGTNEQGATMPVRLIVQRTTDFNYTTIHRDSYGFTETALATDWYGGPLDAKERKKKAIEHKRNIENSFFFGARSYSVGTKPRHSTGGLQEYIAAANVTDAAGAFDKGELQDWLRTSLTYGNRDQKVIFAAPIVCQVLGEFLQDNWVQVTDNDTRVFGSRIDYVIGSAFGARIPVVCKASWEAFGTGATNQIGSLAFLVDMGNVAYAPLRDTALKPNRQAPDADERSAEFISECTLIVQRPETHSILKNVTG
jgi:hypothetical protein